jgi:hypothetical protein
MSLQGASRRLLLASIGLVLTLTAASLSPIRQLGPGFLP